MGYGYTGISGECGPVHDRGFLGSSADALDCGLFRLDRSSCAINHTNRDQFFHCLFLSFKPYFDANDLQYS